MSQQMKVRARPQVRETRNAVRIFPQTATTHLLYCAASIRPQIWRHAVLAQKSCLLRLDAAAARPRPDSGGDGLAARHERAEVRVSLDEPDATTGTLPELTDETPSVEEKILRRERMAAIKSHVQALPERQRVAVVMHKYQGMDYRQIAAVLHLSESATKSLLFRAYETLREKLKEFI